jgi:hypothetical protein
LLLYEIEQQMQQRPILVTYRTPITSNRVQHAADIAWLLSLDAAQVSGQALADTLKQSIKDWRENVPPGGAPDPDTLFQLLRMVIPAGRGVVAVLDAANHKVSNAVWRPICRMLAELADFIIVSLSDKAEANLFRTNLAMGEFQVGWVDAPKITEAKMTALLATRLLRERATAGADPASLTPFTSEALGVLYRPAGGATQTVTWSITVAMSKLAGAFAAKSRALAQALAQGHRPSPAEILITAKDMEDYLAGH